VSTRPAALTAATSVVWSAEFIALSTIVFVGYIAAPPTIGLSFIICADAAELAASMATNMNSMAYSLFISNSPSVVGVAENLKAIRSVPGVWIYVAGDFSGHRLWSVVAKISTD
jgi:hypothetical protein